jgi:Domain of unknown function (DUF1929)
LNTNTWSWTDVPNALSGHNAYAPGLLLPGPPSGSWKVLRLGGSQAGVATTVNEVFDASTPTQLWTALAPLPTKLGNHNTVILPDGTLLTVGGNGDALRGLPNYESYLYDPATNVWTPMATAVQRRTYHSTAVLLPDGRVLAAGDDGSGGGGGGDTDTVETFEPTYLFRGSRPEITAAPTNVAWGQQFAVGSAGGVQRVVLMAAPATTHALDMNQRHVELGFTDAAGNLTVTAPPSAGVAPPGPYMLFVLNAQGVPSVARWVTVGATATATPPVTPTPPSPPAASPGTLGPIPPAPAGPTGPLTIATPLTLEVTSPATGRRSTRVTFVVKLSRVSASPALLQRKVGRRFMTVARGRSSTTTVVIRARLTILGRQTFRVVSGEEGAAVTSSPVRLLVTE